MFNIIILGITSFLTDISSEMVYPLLPLYLTRRLGASPAIAGLIEGIAESLASLLKVFSGYISDRVGRRKPLAILGYASSTVGKLFLYLSTSWGWVLGGRVADRFGKGVRTAPRDALIADSTAQAQRGSAYGLHRALDTAGAVVGVALAYTFLTARPTSSCSSGPRTWALQLRPCCCSIWRTTWSMLWSPTPPVASQIASGGRRCWC